MRIGAMILFGVTLMPGVLYAAEGDFVFRRAGDQPGKFALAQDIGNGNVVEPSDRFLISEAQAKAGANALGVRDIPLVTRTSNGTSATASEVSVPKDDLKRFIEAATGDRVQVKPDSMSVLDSKSLFARRTIRFPSAGKEITVVDKIMSSFLALFDLVLNLIMWFLGILLSLAGMFTDFILSIKRLAGAPAIIAGWRFTRDALNFVFILSLLTIAFSTIAGIESYGMRALLPRLLIVALLVNFSLAIAGAFLQTATVLANTAIKGLNNIPVLNTCRYQKLTPGSQGGFGTSITCALAQSASVGKQFTFGPSEYLPDLIFPRGTNVFSPRNNEGTAVFTRVDILKKSFEDNLAAVISAAVAAVFVGLFTIALISLALMLTVRVAMLALLLILAPVPYVFSIVPRASAWGEKWWSTFIQYTVFLPAIVFFLVIAISLMTVEQGIVKQLEPDIKTLGIPAGIRSNVILASFEAFFVSSFIMISLFVAKALGLRGADAALGFARRVTGGAVRLGAAPGVYAGRAAGFAAGYGARGVVRGAAELAGRIPGVGGAFRAARTGVGAVRAAEAGKERDELISEQQKKFKSYDKTALRNLMVGGNAAAASELLDRGELGSEKDFSMARSLLPGGGAMGEKLDRAFKSKLGVTAETGIPTSALKVGANVATRIPSIQAKAAAIRKNLSKVKDEDIGKPEVQGQFFAAIKAASDSVQKATTGDHSVLGKVPIEINPARVRTLTERGGDEVRDALEEYVRLLKTKDILQPAVQKAAEDRLAVKFT
jgi:hypothetical protein